MNIAYLYFTRPVEVLSHDSIRQRGTQETRKNCQTRAEGINGRAHAVQITVGEIHPVPTGSQTPGLCFIGS